MKNSIWQEFVLEKKTIGIFAAIAGGSWLVGILGMLIFQAFIKNDKALFPIATVLLVGIGSIFLLFLLANSFAHKFNLAISMGRTRKSYLPSVAFLIFVIVLMVYVMGGIGFLIEKGIYGLLYHGRKLTGNMGPFLTPAWLLCYTVFETGLICLYGGLMKKDRKMGTIDHPQIHPVQLRLLRKRRTGHRRGRRPAVPCTLYPSGRPESRQLVPSSEPEGSEPALPRGYQAGRERQRHRCLHR